MQEREQSYSNGRIGSTSGIKTSSASPANSIYANRPSADRQSPKRTFTSESVEIESRPGAASPTRMSSPPRGSFESTLRSDSSLRTSFKGKSPTRSPSKSPSPVRNDSNYGSSWKSKLTGDSRHHSSGESSRKETSKSETFKSSSESQSRSLSSSSQSRNIEDRSDFSRPGTASFKVTTDSKIDKERAAKCGENEDTWPKISSVLTSTSSAHRSPSRDSSELEKHVRINLEPIQKSSYSHQESSSSYSSKSESGSEPVRTHRRREEIAQTLEIPEDGWSLKDAIKSKLLNPRTADVVEPGRSAASSAGGVTRPVSLYRALEKGYLDDHGNYISSNKATKISLDDALERKYVTFDDKVKTSDHTLVKVIRIVRTEGPDSREVTLESKGSLGSSNGDKRTSKSNIQSSKASSATSSSARATNTSNSARAASTSSPLDRNKSESLTKYEEFVELGRSVFYSPASDTIFDEVTGEKMSLKEALQIRRINPDQFSVIDTSSSEPMSLSEASRRKIFDSTSYEVFDSKRSKTFSLSESVKRGLFVLKSSPLLLMESATAACVNPSEKSATQVDSDSHGTGSRLIRETVQVLKSREVFIKDPKTGREIPLDEALRKGLIDKATADRLRNKDAKESGFSVRRSIDLTVHDPRTGEPVPIDLAVRKGIIDEATADRIRRGDVIENVVQTNVTVVDDETENWADIVSEINQRLDLIQEFKQFQENYTLVKKWLAEIEQRIRRLEADDESDLKLVESQRREVLAMKEEFRVREKTLKAVDEAGKSCQSRMERDSAEYTRIERLVSTLHAQWDSCYSALNNMERKLKDLNEFGEKFFAKLSSVDEALWQIQKDLDCLMKSRIEVHEKEMKLECLEEKLIRQRSTIGECEAISDHLCQLMTDSSASTKIRNKFNEIERKYRELSHEIKEASISLKDFGKFDSSADLFQKWQETVKKSFSKYKQVTFEEKALKEEFEKVESVFREIKRKEVDFEDLIERGHDLASRLKDTYESERIEKRLNEINSTWEIIRKEAQERLSRLESGLEESRKVHRTVKKFTNWLDQVEVEFSNIQDITCHRTSLEKQMKDLSRIQHEITQHRDDFHRISELKMTCSNVETSSLKTEIHEACHRYEEITNKTEKHSRKLKESLERFEKFESCFHQAKSEVQKLEDKIESSNVMRTSSLDSKLTEKAKNLMATSNSIGEKVFRVETEATKLSHEVEHGSEWVLREAKSLVERFETIKDNLSSRLEEIETASRSIEKIQKKMELIEKEMAREEMTINRLQPISNDSVILEKQSRELEEIHRETEKVSQVISEARELIQEEVQSSAGQAFEASYRNYVHLIKSIETRHTTNLAAITERRARIESALRNAREFEEKLEEFEQWLSSTEQEIERLEEASYLAETIENQIEETQRIQESIEIKSKVLTDLERSGGSAGKSAKELLVSIRHRWNKLTSKCTERAKNLDRNLKLAREFLNKWSGIMDWLSSAESLLESSQNSSQNVEKMAELLREYKELSREFEHKTSSYESTLRSGRTLKEKCPKADSPVFQRMLDELKTKWESTYQACIETTRRLEKNLNSSSKYRQTFSELSDWANKCNLTTDRIQGDFGTVQKLIKEHSVFQRDLKTREESFSSVQKLAEDLMNSVSLDEASQIRKDLKDLGRKMNEISATSSLRERKLQEALKEAESLKSEVDRLLDWLVCIETSIMKMDSSSEDESTVRCYNVEIERVSKEMEREEVNRDKTIASAQNILLGCHPDAEYIVRHYITVIESRWDEVSGLLKQKQARIGAQLDEILKKMDSLEEILNWLKRAEKEFREMDSKPVPDETDLIQEMIYELERFKDSVYQKTPELDDIASQYYRTESKTRKISSKTSHMVRVTASDVNTEDISNSKAREIVERWQHLVNLIADRAIRLKSKLNYFMELEKLRDFDFDEWRQRFLDWMNEKKAKILDFFRKMDENHDGKVNYQEFIEGFLKSKFPTSRGEMIKVAPIFDRNNDGFIDSKEWMDTLRDKTEAELIKDEVFKQVAKCTCRDKYKVFQVEERKYRFGESQKLRLVRILRSVVMVRVGGGWVSLNEFLLKNDPCRAKGRTNVELREPLADGVSQSMAAFQPKITSTPDGGNHIYGPITKIREKTDRSIPMSMSMESEELDGLGDSPSRNRSQSQSRFGASSRASDEISNESLECLAQHHRVSRVDSKPRWR